MKNNDWFLQRALNQSIGKVSIDYIKSLRNSAYEYGLDKDDIEVIEKYDQISSNKIYTIPKAKFDMSECSRKAFKPKHKMKFKCSTF